MISVCIYFLAKNPDIQEKLFQEINDAEYNENTKDYNTVMGLQYLDMVVHEAMRHAPILEIGRLCVKDYKVPGTNFTVPKGMLIQMSAPGIMMDERYFPNPSRFDPEHFSPRNKEKRNPYAFLVFGIGPRNCIGSRLGLLQVKVGIAQMVHKFKIVATPRTPAKFEVNPTNQTGIEMKGGTWVKFERRGVRGRRLSRQGSLLLEA